MRVTCDWAPNGVLAAPPDAAIVIVDVLSFSTAVSIACARGVIVAAVRLE
jgi:hypothetical protein